MIGIVLALGSALSWGSGDFIGGFATKRTSVTAVVVVSQLAGLTLLAGALTLLPGRPDPASMLWGAGAGLAGGLALLVFYRSLATGAMSVVAPLTALANSAVPVLVGVGLGEHPGPAVWVGVSLAVAAAVLVSAENGRLPAARDVLADRAILGALIAGSLFGLFFVLVSRSAPSSGLWPLAAARVASITVIGLIALVAGRTLLPAPRAVPQVVLAGVLDMTANVMFLLASRQALLIITAVLGALYPATTVLLARLVLHERMSRPQLAGFAVAGLAVSCIALG